MKPNAGLHRIWGIGKVLTETYTTHEGTVVTFDVVVDDVLHNLLEDDIDPKNKALLSLVNSFENGVWRRVIFERFIWDNIKETALSETEKSALIGSEQSIISRSADALRLLEGDEKGGEIGEILLYGVMKKYYSALPVVPKIFYKQNTNKGTLPFYISLE